jgi:acyl carrier protein
MTTSSAHTGEASATEVALLGLWRSVLGVEDLSPTDDFFFLGGDSLTGVALLDEVSSSFGVELPPLAMYDEASTVATMAAYIDRLQSAGA